MAPERVFVGLGANLGDPQSALQQALAELAALPGTRLVAASSPYRTAPVDAAGPDFINAVAELETRLEPQDLLRSLQAIEQAHDRQRPYRNAPRSLDLDLLLYGQRVLRTPVLDLPHPRAHRRRFVLQPLAELDPGLRLPGLGAVADLVSRVADQEVEKLPWR